MNKPTPKTTFTDGRDFKRHTGTGNSPEFRSRCPHCDRVHLWSFDSKLSTFGFQRSQVVKCNHTYKEGSSGTTTIMQGCGKRYVIDIRVDVLATAIPLVEDI